MVTPDVRRKAVAHACAEHGVSKRRARKALSSDRTRMRYRSVRPDDTILRDAMKAVASERRRFGYPSAGRQLLAIAVRRRIHVMLRRQGIVMNQTKLHRLYREESSSASAGWPQGGAWHKTAMLVPDRVNVRWRLAFVSDAFTRGRRFRVLAVVDDFSRECLALVADTSLLGLRVTRELDALMAVRGKPSRPLNRP